MKTTTATIFSLLSAFAAAQSSGAASSTSNMGPTTTMTLSPVASCINTCNPGDVDCQASCVGGAHPNGSQANATTDCASRCNQGTGSPADNEAYGQCLANCIKSDYPTTGSGTAVGLGVASSGASASATMSNAMATATDSGSGMATSTGGSSGSSSGSGSSSSPTASAASSQGAAAEMASANAPFAGLAALFMAVLAL